MATFIELCITAVIKMGCLWFGEYSMQSKMMPSRHALPRFHPRNWAEVFIWQNFLAYLPRSWLENLRSQEPSPPTLSYEHVENFTKDLKVGWDLGNWPGQPGQPVSWRGPCKSLEVEFITYRFKVMIHKFHVVTKNSLYILSSIKFL